MTKNDFLELNRVTKDLLEFKNNLLEYSTLNLLREDVEKILMEQLKFLDEIGYQFLLSLPSIGDPHTCRGSFISKPNEGLDSIKDIAVELCVDRIENNLDVILKYPDIPSILPISLAIDNIEYTIKKLKKILLNDEEES